MDVSASVTVPLDRHVLPGAGARRRRRARDAASADGCDTTPGASRARRPTTATAPTPSWSSTPATRAAARRRSETRFQYAISAGSAVTPPPGKLLTRKPDSFVINTFPLGVTLNPGAISYESATRATASCSPTARSPGPSSRRSSTRPPASPTSASTKPGRYLIVARAERGEFFTPWSAPTDRQRDRAVRPRAASRSPTHAARATSCAARSASTPRAARSRSTSPRARRRASSTASARRRSTRRAASRSASRSATPAPTGCATSTGAPALWRPGA